MGNTQNCRLNSILMELLIKSNTLHKIIKKYTISSHNIKLRYLILNLSLLDGKILIQNLF